MRRALLAAMLLLACALVSACGSAVTESAATPTTGPSPTATKPLTPEQALTQLVKSALEHDSRKTNGLSVTYDLADPDKIVTVEKDADDNLTGDLIKFGIKEDAETVMQALYTQWPATISPKPSQVTFHDNGATKDKYGNPSKGPWGTAVLYAETAAKFNWDGLNQDEAWNDYDVAFFINGL